MVAYRIMGTLDLTDHLFLFISGQFQAGLVNLNEATLISADFGKFFSHSSAPFFIYLSLNPAHNQRHDKIDLLNIQHPALLDSMPFFNATPATCGSCMLSNEYRMPSHRSLFTIILRKIRRNPGIHKLKCVLFDGSEIFGCYVISIFSCQLEF